MIASGFEKGFSNIKQNVFYHEKKINNDKAQVLKGNTVCETAIGFIYNMEAVARSNPAVYKNKYYDISLNFAPQDGNLSDEKILNIAHDYMDKMNISNNPYRIYRHYDASHEHVHIVFSSIDFEGNQTFKNKLEVGKTSFETCRELEKKHDLYQVQSVNRERARFSLNELNLDRYSYQNALKKAFKRSAISKQIGENYNATMIHNLTKKPLTNKEIQSKIGEKAYNDIYQILDRNKLFNKHYKVMLMKKLDNILKEAHSPDHYQELCQNSNIYIRPMKYDSRIYYKYILQQENINFEVNDSSLSARFRYNSIHNIVELKQDTAQTNKLTPTHKTYFKSSISKALSRSNTFSELAENLIKFNIEYEFVKNKKGDIYGINFKQIKVHFKAEDDKNRNYHRNVNTNIYKGSDIDRSFSYNKLKETLENNLDNTLARDPQLTEQHSQDKQVFDKDQKSLQNIGNSVAGSISGGKKQAIDGEEEEKRLKRKNRNL